MIDKRNSNELSSLKSEGWIEGYGSIYQRLTNVVGRRIDCDRFNNLVSTQKRGGSIYRFYDNAVATFDTADMKVFDTGEYCKKTGEKVFARFRRKIKQNWVGVDFVPESKVALARNEIINRDSFYCQIELPPEPFYVGELYFLLGGDDPNNPYRIQGDRLRDRLKYTYYMLRRQGRLLEQKEYMIFNTGLLDKSGHQIYAYFISNDKGVKPWRTSDSDDDNPRPWIYKGFGTREGVSEDSKFIRSHIREKNLETVKWEYDKFNPNLKIEVKDYEHCMIENALRIPRHVIAQAFTDKTQGDDAIRFLDEIDRAISFLDLRKCVGKEIWDECKIDFPTKKNRLEIYFTDPKIKQCVVSKFFKSLPNYDNVFERLKNCLDNAVSATKRMIEADCSMAIPNFYPTEDYFSFFLPLAFDVSEGSSKEYRVLVVKKGEQCYVAKTILTREMAQKDSLLLGKSHRWLVDGTSNER